MINKVNPFQITANPVQIQNSSRQEINKQQTSDFSNTLKQAIEKINQSQIESDKMTEALSNGKNVELHDVMITAQKASVTMTLAVEVRNKAIEAYQEMMRMQV